jgi:hypothetical protein
LQRGRARFFAALGMTAWKRFHTDSEGVRARFFAALRMTVGGGGRRVAAGQSEILRCAQNDRLKKVADSEVLPFRRARLQASQFC